ncbi:MAG TPA: LysM domain-containing protein [Chthoniobacter sp.]|jgi:LysM repeat protein
MAPKTTFFMLVAMTIAGTSLQAATPENAEREYQQVRTIALRDPKVRAAYEEADRKLQEKIVQIDPALSDYVHHRSSSSTVAATSTSSEPGGFRKPKKTESSTKSAPKAAPSTSSTTYVVKSGDTLGAIASHYGVTVAALKKANQIADEKKLAVGQELKIPGRGK